VSSASNIDRALLGASHSEDIEVASLGGLVVRVRVLSPLELASLQVALSAISNEPSAKAESVSRHRVLHAACSMPSGSPAFGAPSMVGKLPAEVTGELMAAYVRLHDRTHSIDRAMQDEIDTMTGERDRWVERFRAHYAEGLVAYFGIRCALEATTAQVLWFHGLMRDRT
jgi:hypothetical protein